MVAHKDVVDSWIRGYESKGSRMFTDGTTIWSHGYHFPIAHKLKSGKILFNTDSYSRSTGKHQSYTRQGIYNEDHIIECNTSKIKQAMDNPSEPIIIVKEEKPRDLNSIMNCLKIYCKDQGMKRFPKVKLIKQIEQMLFIERL